MSDGGGRREEYFKAKIQGVLVIFVKQKINYGEQISSFFV